MEKNHKRERARVLVLGVMVIVNCEETVCRIKKYHLNLNIMALYMPAAFSFFIASIRAHFWVLCHCCNVGLREVANGKDDSGPE